VAFLVARGVPVSRRIVAGVMTARVVAAGIMAAGIMEAGAAALGVFFRFQVLHFDFLLSRHVMFLSGCLVLVCPWHRRAIDARL
jgi:hypothetical protein